jgi:hypothetical protein
MNPDKREIIEARIIRDQAWAYERRIVDALPWQSIRALALRPAELGGIGANVSTGTLRGMVAAHRAAQGDVVGTREERIERRQLEIDALALGARAALERAHAVGALDVHAAKVLLEARAAEAKMHGDDTPAELIVTHRDALLDELNASLLAMGEKPVRIES